MTDAFRSTTKDSARNAGTGTTKWTICATNAIPVAPHARTPQIASPVQMDTIGKLTTAVYALHVQAAVQPATNQECVTLVCHRITSTPTIVYPARSIV